MLGQFYIDDNMFNSFASVATTIDKMFSARELMKRYPNSKKFLDMLTTSTIGAVMPQFTEEYGENKKIDIVASPSHDLFLDGVPDSKMSGIYMDKNGNWKVQLNVPLQINVESMPGMWEPVRNLYITLVAKAKVQTKVDENGENKMFVLMPRSIEMSQMIVKKGDEEIQMEQMMIQSMANIQLEQVKKLFKEIPIKVNTLLKRLPKELQCFGFKISDLDISFKKSQVQVSAYQTAAEDINQDLCDKFTEELNSHQAGLLEKI